MHVPSTSSVSASVFFIVCFCCCILIFLLVLLHFRFLLAVLLFFLWRLPSSPFSASSSSLTPVLRRFCPCPASSGGPRGDEVLVPQLPHCFVGWVQTAQSVVAGLFGKLAKTVHSNRSQALSSYLGKGFWKSRDVVQYTQRVGFLGPDVQGVNGGLQLVVSPSFWASPNQRCRTLP